MFRDLKKLKSRYSTDKNDIVQEFYNPILKCARRYDRLSAYFSSKSLSLYSQGLEFFAKRGSKFRLIISQEISQEDYQLIKDGYFLRTEIKSKMLSSLDQKLSAFEEKNLSNLAYLISIGVIDIKFAFLSNGIFHEKCGIFYDDNGDIITFNGSINETEAAISRNYESFFVYLSWVENDNFYKTTINESILHFEELWNNQNKNILVVNAEEVILNKIGKFNKNKIILDESYLITNSIIFDVNDSEEVFIYLNFEKYQDFLTSSTYKMHISYNVRPNNNFLFIKESSLAKYNELFEIVKLDFSQKGFKVLKSIKFEEFLKNKNLHIEERKKIGINIKNKEELIKENFLKYKDLLDNLLKRKLREEQMWDSFFMTSMRKSCNFSVPGSGKTSSVLGTFAFLKNDNKNPVNKIIVIGPKNCFQSWIDEFCACIGENELKHFDIQSNNSKEDKKDILEYAFYNYNLILINYEALISYHESIKKIIQGNELLVFDEIHRIKKIDGVRAKAAIDIAKKACYTVALTGTPIPNSYSDLFNTLNILFGAEYSYFFGFSEYDLKNPTDSEKEKILNAIFPFFCRTTKNDLNVPKPNEDIINKVFVSDKENELFHLIYSKYNRNYFELFVRLLQLESNPKMILEKIDINDFKDMFDCDNWEKEINEISLIDNSKKIIELVNSIDKTSKKKECIKLLTNLIMQEKQVIVWCIFKKTMRSFLEDLQDLKIIAKIVDGETSLEDRKQIIEDFKNKRFKVLITNSHTLAESVSLHTVCHDAIYFEYSYNLVHLLQSKDRIHRLGLEDNQYTQWYFLHAMYEVNKYIFSMDEKIYLRLKEKEKIMIDAIENNQLETPTTDQEDLETIFKEFDLMDKVT